MNVHRSRRSCGLLALIAGLACLLLPAAADAAFQVPKPVSRTLPNGLVVHVFEDHDLPTVYYRMLVRAGSLQDSPDKAGLANLTALVMRQGTQSRTAPELSQQIDFVGGQLYLQTDRDYTMAGAQARRSDRQLVLELLADVIQRPAFSAEEVGRQKSQLQAAITQSLDDPETVVENHFLALVHGAHPYARPVIGDEHSVGGLTREDLVRFHETYYRPNNAILVVAGDVNAAEEFTAIEKALGGWSRAEIPPRTPADQPALERNRVRLIDRDDLVQSQIRIGYVGLPRENPDYFPMLVANYILGGGGFASRMMAEVRSRAGLTYDAATLWSYGLEPGTFTISTFTKNESVKDAIDLMLGVVRKFRDQGATAAELEQAKAYFVGAFPFGLQTPGLVAESWLRTQFYGLGEDYLQRYRERVQAVTAADVKRVSQQHLRTEPVVIAVIGKAAVVDTQLVAFGDAERVPFTARTGAIPEVEPEKPAAIAPATPESKKKAADVIAKAVKAHGGTAALRAIRDWRAQGAIQLTMGGQQLEGEFSEIAAMPARRRMEMKVLGQSLVQVLNGETGFSIAGGQTVPMEGEQLEAMRMGGFSHPVRLLLVLVDPTSDVRYVGERESFGKEVEVVEWIRADGRPAQVGFDEDTGLLFVLEQPEVSQMGGSWTPVQRVYEDDRLDGKIQFPHKVTVWSGGEKAVEQSLASVQWNVGVDPKLFAPVD